MADARHSQDDVSTGQAYQLLAMTCYWFEAPEQGIAYSRQAIDVLKRAQVGETLGMAYIVQGLNALLAGDFALALEAVAQADALGTTRGEPHLQTYAAWLTGWIQATRGAWNEGIAPCQHSLALSIEPLHTAFAQGWLGYAYLGQGNPAAAVPLLKEALQQMQAYGYPRCARLFTTVLAAAHLSQGHLDVAQALGQQACAISDAAAHRFGSGWARRVLGRIAQAAGAPGEAWDHVQAALATFATLPARFEVGRTHLALGELAQAQGHHAAACQHLTEAHRLFQVLGVAPHVERTAHQARAVGLALPV